MYDSVRQHCDSLQDNRVLLNLSQNLKQETISPPSLSLILSESFIMIRYYDKCICMDSTHDMHYC